MNDKLIKKNLENETCWWLRSAYSDDSYDVGYVGDDGSVNYYNYAYLYDGVVPACLII